MNFKKNLPLPGNLNICECDIIIAYTPETSQHLSKWCHYQIFRMSGMKEVRKTPVIFISSLHSASVSTIPGFVFNILFLSFPLLW